MNFKGMKLHWKLLFLMFFITYGIVTYWLYYPYTPLVIESIEILNPGKEVCPGGRLEYELKFDKKMPLAAVIHKQLINHYIITYTPIVGNVSTGPRTAKATILIPHYAADGTYSLKWEAVYKVNPIREVRVHVHSDGFTVKRGSL